MPAEALVIYQNRWMCILCRFIQRLDNGEVAVICDDCHELMEPGLLVDKQGRSLCPICILTPEDLEEIEKWMKHEQN